NGFSRSLESSMHLTEPLEARVMLRITTEKKRAKTVLSVEGRLAGPNVTTLEQCWREIRAASPQEKFYVDLCGVSYIDGAGKMLLRDMHRNGGHLVAQGCLNQAIVKEIVGEEKAGARGEESKRKTPIIFYVALLGLALAASGLWAQEAPPARAELQGETTDL